MKILTILSLIALLTSPSNALHAQNLTFQEQIKRTFISSPNVAFKTLALYNLSGSVVVEGYQGREVTIEAVKIVRAPNNVILSQGKKEVQLEFIQHSDSIVVFMPGRYESRPYHRAQPTNGDERISYGYEINLTVKVPEYMRVNVSTITNGKILISNVIGLLRARNVNGSVTIQNAKEVMQVRTINGEIAINYTYPPSLPCEFYSVNGNILINYPANTAADIYIKNIKGEVLTNLPKITLLPARATKNQQHDGQSTEYKLTQGTAIRLGKGGPVSHVETLNGKVTINQRIL